ncbi:MAG: MBL fold metallo-hydrolase [Xanthobacteraceae bacterium]|uniref:MBL fold metallo-hydrolase n=1 Tax=Pseudolabrys sp. TaxID=1960880 RepID=UPI003D0EFB05
MTQFTRRDVFATAAGAAATAAAGFNPLTLASANAQGVAGSTTGVYRYKLGDIELIQVLDGARTFPMPDKFVANVDKEQAAAAFEGLYMPKGQVTISFSPLIVKSGGKTIAIDTGNGLGAFAATKGAVGNTRANMQAAGIDVKAVDIVLISHFHGDHINGLKNADGTPAYTSAEIKVPEAEQKFWTDESNQSKANGANKGNFANVKKVFDGLKTTPFEVGKEVAPGITAIATPGHTPGHVSFIISSGSKKLVVQGDVTNQPGVFMRNPNWHLVFDNDGAMAEATRRKFYDMAMAEKMPVVGYHFPFPAAGYVEKDGNGYRLIQVHALT